MVNLFFTSGTLLLIWSGQQKSRIGHETDGVNPENKSVISPFHLGYLILIFISSACAVDQGKEPSPAEEEDTNPGITVIFESDSESPYTLSKDQTFHERLGKIPNNDTLTVNRDTVFFSLDEEIQLIYGRTPLKFDQQTLLVKTRDTIYIKLKNDKTEIFKLLQNKKESIQWADSMIMTDNELRRKMEALRSVFVREERAGELSFFIPNKQRKNEWSTSMNDYIKVIDSYYGLLLDSLSLISGKENALYKDILKRKQFFELQTLNSAVNDPSLSERLNSTEFINLDHFNNRYFNTVFASHFHKNYAFNKKILLADVYKEGFTEYPIEMRQSFKAKVIQSMIVKKNDRDTILKYVNAYKDEFGNITPLEAILAEIEYGVVEDHDLILKDHFGSETKWEALRKQWEGKLIYVDFWASWCAPCLRAIPFSKELQKQMMKQEVVFVYLALNDKEKAWREISLKHQIQKNNYLILNSRSSDFISQKKLEAIPRYMIYDKNGKLIHQNAPGPDQKEAFEILSLYLKK